MSAVDARRFRARSRQGGLSMLELLVGLGVATLGLAVVYRALLSFDRQTVAQQRIAAAQSEMLPIQSSLEKNLRRASFRIPVRAPRWKSAGPADTVASLEVSPTGSPNGIIIRGNFTEVFTQTRNPFPRAAARMDVLPGGATGFQLGDTLLLDCGEFQEYLVVTGLNATGPWIGTGNRLNDYPIGTQVIKVSLIRFLPSGGSLSIVTDGKSHRLTRNLSDLRFEFIRFDGTLESLPPFQPQFARSIQYRVKLQIPKPGAGGGFLYREVTGRVMLRNAI